MFHFVSHRKPILATRNVIHSMSRHVHFGENIFGLHVFLKEWSLFSDHSLEREAPKKWPDFSIANKVSGKVMTHWDISVRSKNINHKWFLLSCVPTNKQGRGPFWPYLCSYFILLGLFNVSRNAHLTRSRYNEDE